MSTAPGDSGAWVFDRSTGSVCGHVLAWSAKSSTTYITPMEVTLDDIARTLNASLVSLPGAPAETIGFSSTTSPPPAQYRCHTQQPPEHFSRLALGGGAVNSGPPMPPPPHSFPHPHAQHHPGYARPPPPPPPPRPPPESRGPVYRRMPPIPPSLLNGPRNIERQLA